MDTTTRTQRLCTALLGALCAVALATGLLLATAGTQQAQAEEAGVSALATSTVASGTTGTCTWELDSGGTLTIAPADGASGVMGDAANTAPWYYYYWDINAVVVEDGVTYIGDYAFCDLNCTSVTLCDDVESIGDYAFAWCGAYDYEGDGQGVCTLVIPDSVTSIGDYAFWETWLVDIVVGSGVTSVGECAFGDQYNYETSVTFRGNAPDLDDETFKWDVDLTVYYPSNNPTWTDEVIGQLYGAESLTWVGYESATPFPDVQDPTKWYYSSVYAMADAGYITGYDTGYFGATDKMKREQFVTILWRMACPEDAASYDVSTALDTTGLKDVTDGKYYTEAINWAYREGVVTGYTSGSNRGKFGVGDTISFQQMCLILARYVTGETDVTTQADSSSLLASFSDASKISSYAEDGMAWCVENGLVVGNDDGTLAPRQNVSRARVAVVLCRAVDDGIL